MASLRSLAADVRTEWRFRQPVASCLDRSRSSRRWVMRRWGLPRDPAGSTAPSSIADASSHERASSRSPAADGRTECRGRRSALPVSFSTSNSMKTISNLVATAALTSPPPAALTSPPKTSFVARLSLRARPSQGPTRRRVSTGHHQRRVPPNHRCRSTSRRSNFQRMTPLSVSRTGPIPDSISVWLVMASRSGAAPRPGLRPVLPRRNRSLLSPPNPPNSAPDRTPRHQSCRCQICD
mmetsp:Transcript_19992/g.36170  ORF Transcript_19992/g.36170 Transcript_19992/m.36170 type:complete len:238 (+) Transcript_19992:212-925(+)